MASDSSKLWSVFSLGAAIGAATLAKKALNTSWKAATGKNAKDRRIMLRTMPPAAAATKLPPPRPRRPGA